MTQRLIVEVRGGKSAGTKAVLDPGSSLRFGRTDLSDIVVPHDELLSGVHFELSWDGRRCRVYDRKSLKGTFLDGSPILSANVSHGGWIRAGRTDFIVYVEGHSAPSEAGEGDEDDGDEDALDAFRDAPSAAQQALVALRAEAEPLYAIVDAARDGRILPILRESVERHQSLYEGVEGEALDRVAPYLVGPMRADSNLLDRLVLGGWQKRWGIYATSAAPFREVRRHFRRFLMVDLEDGEQILYFRFYDPWVMEQFLPVANEAQKREIGAMVSALWFERESGELGSHAFL